MKKIFNTKIKKQNNRAFTLIELLVVVAIIGILSSVVLASLNSAREKARDAQRFSDIKQIQNALELYYNDKGFYPKLKAHTEIDSGCGGHTTWCGATGSLSFELSPYIKLPLKNDAGFDKSYYYYSTAGDNYQTYGFMLNLDSSAGILKEQSDGGNYTSLYEVGYRPKYCKDKYNEDWWFASTFVCLSGN